MKSEGHFLRTVKMLNLKKIQVIINIRNNKRHILIDRSGAYFKVLPFKSMSVSLYMDFFKISGLDVCRTVNKCLSSTVAYIYLFIHNQFGETDQ